MYLLSPFLILIFVNIIISYVFIVFILIILSLSLSFVFRLKFFVQLVSQLCYEFIVKIEIL